MTGYTADNKKLILMQHSGMSCASFRNRPGDCRLGPVSSFQIEYDEVGKVSAMFILTTKYEKLIALI